MNPFKSIRGKLLVFCLSLSLIPIAVLTAIYYEKLSCELGTSQIKSLLMIAKSKETHLLSVLDAKKGRAIDFGSDGFIRDQVEKINPNSSHLDKNSHVDALTRHLVKNKKPLDPYISHIAVLDIRGIVVASTCGNWVGRNYANDSIFLEGMKTSYGNAMVNQPLFCTHSNKNSIYITAPLTSRRLAKEEKIGLIINCYDLDILNTITKIAGEMGKTGEVYLVDMEKRMITQSRFVEDAPLNLLVDTEPVQKFIASGKAMMGMYSDYRGVPVVGVSINISQYGWILLAEIDRSEIFASLRSVEMIVFSLSILCVVAVIVVGTMYSSSFVRPINRLKTITQRIASGELEQRVGIDRKDEIGELAASFNAMADNLQKAINEANSANEAKSMFLSSMSHELRTPMNSILGFAQVLKSDPVTPLTDAQNQCVELMLSSGNHLLALINDVLDLSRIESGRISISPEIFLLDTVIAEVVAIFESVARKGSIKVIDKTDKSGIYIETDRIRIKQVITNLISNAVKYNRKNGTVTIYYTFPDNDRVCLKIEDTGYGIPEEELSSLFKPFTRLGMETTNIEGTGIGLTITKRLVELLGGRIGVESVVGKGSTFFVDFKRTKEPSGAVQETKEALDIQHSYKPTSHKTLLCIEDNAANLVLVQNILKRRPFIEFVGVVDAESGIELIRGKRPDVILLDINLPGMDGYEALRILKSSDDTKDIPVIALSASAMQNEVEKGKSAGFFHYITKPVNVSQFLHIVDTALKETEQ